MKAKKCKYCNKDAEQVSYRENNLIVSKEIVCHDCHHLTNKTLNLKGGNFEEGDDYWALEFNRGRVDISESCWDDQSEDIASKDIFRELSDCLTYCMYLGIKEVNVYTMGKTNGYGESFKLIIKDTEINLHSN